MRLEITHTIRPTDYEAFITKYREALAKDRKSNPEHKEPRVLVSLFGELNRIRIEFELGQTDLAFQNWLKKDCPSMIEGMATADKEQFFGLSEKIEVAWVRDVDVSSAG